MDVSYRIHSPGRSRERLCATGVSMRKGQMYSLIVLIISIPVMFYITYYMASSQSIGHETMESIVTDQVLEVARSMESDFERGITISCKRAMLSAINTVIQEGSYLGDSRAAIRELMLNGTLDGELSLVMGNNRLSDWRDQILAVDSGFVADAEFSEPEIGNWDGLHVLVKINLTINVSDVYGTARIDRHYQKDVLVPVEGLEDPIFPLSTMGYVMRVVRETPYDFYARKLPGTPSAGNCSGRVRYDYSSPDDGSHILVIYNATGIANAILQSFAGVVNNDTEDLSAKGVSCFVSGVSDAPGLLPFNESVYIDGPTSSVWRLPIAEIAQEGYYYYGSGPSFLQRLEGDLSPSPDGRGMETFVRQEFGLPDKPSQSRLAWKYFSSSGYTACYKARWMDSFWRVEAADIGKYNLTELDYAVC
jgi:hypothetical protein